MNDSKATGLVILACAMWGFSFPATDYALHYFDPFIILSLRFCLAIVLLGMLLVWQKRFSFTPAELQAGLLTGVMLFLGFATQIIGQQTISPTVSAFITGFYVILVPLFSALLLARWPSWKILLCALVALAGLFLLSGATLTMGFGQWITVFCAITVALHILLLNRFGSFDTTRLAFLQLVVCAVLSLVAIPLLGHLPTQWPLEPLLAVAFLGIFASAFAYWALTSALKTLESERTALLMLGEPLFAALFGWLFFSILLSPIQLAGGALMLIGMAGAQVAGRRSHVVK